MNDTGRAIHQAIERTEANIAWMNKNHKTIVGWLSEQVDNQEKNEILL